MSSKEHQVKKARCRNTPQEGMWGWEFAGIRQADKEHQAGQTDHRHMHTAAALLLPLCCCRSAAAALLLPLCCCRSAAAALLLPLCCCRSAAAALLLPLCCCRSAAAALLLAQRCCCYTFHCCCCLQALAHCRQVCRKLLGVLAGVHCLHMLNLVIPERPVRQAEGHQADTQQAGQAGQM
jgi:hypothetical protein